MSLSLSPKCHCYTGEFSIQLYSFSPVLRRIFSYSSISGLCQYLPQEDTENVTLLLSLLPCQLWDSLFCLGWSLLVFFKVANLVKKLRYLQSFSDLAVLMPPLDKRGKVLLCPHLGIFSIGHWSNIAYYIIFPLLLLKIIHLDSVLTLVFHGLRYNPQTRDTRQHMASPFPLFLSNRCKKNVQNFLSSLALSLPELQQWKITFNLYHMFKERNLPAAQWRLLTGNLKYNFW